MTNPLAIRAARIDDMAAVARLFRMARQTALPYLPDLHTPEEDLWFFRERVFPAGAVWIAGTDQLAGFCACRSGWIEHLYIHPKHQGRGLGTAFVRQATTGQASVRLWVFQKNAAAIRFYEARGFTLIQRMDGRDNEEKEPDALYEWRREA